MKDQIVKIITDYLNKMEVPKEKWDGTVGFFPAEWPLPTCTIADEIAEKLTAAIVPHLEAGAGDITKIREAFARYVYTEGCSCCRDSEGHEVAEKELAELLKPLPYVDSSGWDWDKPA